MHVAHRDSPDQSPVVAERKGQVQTPPVIGMSKGVKVRFRLAVSDIRKQQKGFNEKHLLGFRLTDPMFVHAFARVPRVPLKALAQRQINHGMYMIHIYVACQSSYQMAWNLGADKDMFAS
jgi:hypothetical protein